MERNYKKDKGWKNKKPVQWKYWIKRFSVIVPIIFFMTYFWEITNEICLQTKHVQCDHGMIYHKGGFKPIEDRLDIGNILESKKFKTGAEVGVQGGNNAKNILERWPSCVEFHLVDLWGHQDNYRDKANLSNEKQDSIYESAQKWLEKFQTKTIFHRMLSVEAAKIISNDSLDFVYIDARHDYCGVTEDIEAYWPKLRPGGIMAGHDFVTAAIAATTGQDWSICLDGSTHPGAVRGAVEDFADKKGLVISVEYNSKTIWKSWMIQKPTKSECV